jgi:hypothetical protein
MRKISTSFCLVLCHLSWACGGGDDGAGGGVDAAAADAASPDAASGDAGPCPGAKIVYLNRGGGMYTSGPDDASNNVSSIIPMAATFAPANLTDPQWAELKSCMEGLYAPFNVSFTDVDPGAAEHREIAYVGNWTATGMSNSIGGVAPAQCFAATDDGLPGAVVLMNPAIFSTDVMALCEASAQVLAYSYGLDVGYHCPDVTSYLANCGAKSFVDMNVQCSEFDMPRACRCGGTEQNSYQWMLTLAGPACQ